MGDYRPKIEQRIAMQVLLLLLMLGLALIQSTLAPTLWRFRVDWVLLIVVGWTLLRGLLPGLNLALYGGIFLDLLGVLPLGTHLLALLICVIGVALIAEPLDREQPLLMIGAMLAAAFVHALTLLAVFRFTGHQLPWASYLFVTLVPLSLINTIMAVPVLAILQRIHRRGRSPVATDFG